MNVRRSAVLLLLCSALIAQTASAASPDVVISQVYGGAGCTTASCSTYQNDYIELFNRSTSAVSLNGWSVQYASAAGTSWAVTALPNFTLQPGQYFLVAENGGNPGTGVNPLPVPDKQGTISMAAGAAKVALSSSTTAFAGTCPTGTALVDLIGYGTTANCSETAAAPAPSTLNAVFRADSGCQDNDNNNTDFTAAAAAPRNSASPVHPCGVVTNNPPSITAPANPIATVTQDAAPFIVTLTGSDDGSIYNWSATPGVGVASINVFIGQGTANVQYAVSLNTGFNGTASFTALLSDNVNPTVSRTVNIQVNPPSVNNPPVITAPADPIATVTQDAAPFTVSLTGSDDHNVYNWSASGGSGISSVFVTGGAGTSTATFTVTLNGGFHGSTSFTASLSDGVNAAATQTVNIQVSVPTLPAGTVVISQIYGGGGNAGSTLHNDFIELFNRSNNAVALDGWSVQHFSSSNPSWFATPLTGVIQPHSYYLVQEAAGTTAGGGTVPLPTPDAIGTIGLSSTAGVVALSRSTTLLSGGICATSSDIADWVGYGAGSACSGRIALGNALSNTIAALRVLGGCKYTPAETDFAVGPPAPRNSATPVNDCSPVTPAPHVMISQLYGGGGNSGATFTNDFVELYNPTNADVSLEGWSIQYTSATGSLWANTTQPLGGSIASHDYFLIELASGGATGASLPPPRIIGDLNMSQTSGKLALVRSFTPLTGNCPIGDPNVVDFIGYGAVDCFEGGLSAPGLSSSKSDIRATNSDTDQNSIDFTAVTPTTPRGTGELVRLPPLVSSTEPATTNAPFDATVTINFSEPVNVADGWYSISCSSTGPHTDVQVTSAFAGKTWAITPNVTFTPGETCTVRVFKSAVTNVDTTGDPNLDNLPNDFQFTFAVAAAVTLPYPPDVHLTLGNPSGAIADTNVPNNYLMSKPQYALSYNRDLGRPNWVSWHLTTEWYGTITRVDTFRPDPMVPVQWYRVQATDFASSGFDRGHMCPNADRDSSTPTMQSTFLMDNMIVQSPDNNQGPWADMEGALRTIADAGNELYIVSGPNGVGGIGSNGPAMTVANGHVTVPAYTWKAALVLPRADGDDVKRVTASTRVIAVIMPNIMGIRGTPDAWKRFETTVDAIEQLTGYDLFSNIPSSIQNAIEAGIDGDNPPGASTAQSVSTLEDNAATFTLDVASPNANPLTYTILTQPAHGSLSGSSGNETYTPAPDFNGTDTFTYNVSNGTQTSTPGRVTITVLEVNDPPVANDDAKSTNEDTPLPFAASDLTANDSTGPNEPTQTLTVTSVTATADTHGVVSLNGAQVSYVPDANFNGQASFVYSVCDNGITSGQLDVRCATATVHVTVISVDDPPSVAMTVAPNSLEGSAVTATVTVTDIDSTAFTYAWTVTKNGSPFVNGVGAPFTFTPDDNGAYVVTVTVTDDGGASGGDTKPVTVANVAPSITSVTGPTSSLPAGSSASITIAFTDPGTADTHTALMTWDDGSSSVATCGANSCVASHTFAHAGVYGIGITLSDDDGGTASANFSYVVVTDANAGFVTGGGWVMSSTGKTSFSVNAKYQKNQSTPTGNTEVQGAGMNFKATSTDWLVVAGPNAQYAGSGTVNGGGSYGYIVTVFDGDTDKFRIRVWDKVSGATVFDNVPGASDDIDAANPQPIGGGSIQIH